jgi:hypothetical protein
MTHTKTLFMGLAILVSLPPLAFCRNCSYVPLQLIVAARAAGQGGISGDGIVIYNNPWPGLQSRHPLSGRSERRNASSPKPASGNTSTASDTVMHFEYSARAAM